MKFANSESLRYYVCDIKVNEVIETYKKNYLIIYLYFFVLSGVR